MAHKRPVQPPLFAAVSTDFGIQFYFHAADDRVATAALDRWNRYHGFRRGPGGGWQTAQRVDDTVSPEWTHDEWIPRT